jgi:uncharacterized protein
MAGFEWDPAKEARNIRDRRIDFTTASLIWQGRVYEKIDDRRDYGEVRVFALGKTDGHILAVVFTWRGENRRIISARRAKARERRLYEAEIRRTGALPN